MAKIYLISPENFEIESFAKDLEVALKTNLVQVFQLRVKNIAKEEIKDIAIRIKRICHDNNCLFILNDDYELALQIQADGVHLGQDDGQIQEARKNCPAKFIIGASCYDSKDLAVSAIESGANYISFGTFFPSKTKNSKGKPTPELLSWASELFDVQICAIGGINDQNYKILTKHGADLICVISYVWQHPKGIEEALKSLSY